MLPAGGFCVDPPGDFVVLRRPRGLPAGGFCVDPPGDRHGNYHTLAEGSCERDEQGKDLEQDAHEKRMV